MARGKGSDSGVHGNSGPEQRVNTREVNKTWNKHLLVKALDWTRRHNTDAGLSNIRIFTGGTTVRWCGVEHIVLRVADLDPGHWLALGVDVLDMNAVRPTVACDLHAEMTRVFDGV